MTGLVDVLIYTVGTIWTVIYTVRALAYLVAACIKGTTEAQRVVRRALPGRDA